MKNNVALYKPSENVRLEVKLGEDTIWLSLNQMSELFQRDKSVISRHLKSVFNSGELSEESTVAYYATVQKEGKRMIERNIEHYNLDAVISVGYRVNSIRGTKFRIWATKVIKERMLQTIDISGKEKSIVQVVKYIRRITDGKELQNDESRGLLSVILEYSNALNILDAYDHKNIVAKQSSIQPAYRLTIKEVRTFIKQMNEKFRSSELFGKEKDKSLESSIASIYQTFEGVDLYLSVESKAANLLYFLVKNHSFVEMGISA